jgi:hypothetical protein
MWCAGQASHWPSRRRTNSSPALSCGAQPRSQTRSVCCFVPTQQTCRARVNYSGRSIGPERLRVSTKHLIVEKNAALQGGGALAAQGATNAATEPDVRPFSGSVRNQLRMQMFLGHPVRRPRNLQWATQSQPFLCVAWRGLWSHTVLFHGASHTRRRSKTVSCLETKKPEPDWPPRRRRGGLFQRLILLREPNPPPRRRSLSCRQGGSQFSRRKRPLCGGAKGPLLRTYSGSWLGWDAMMARSMACGRLRPVRR